MSSDKNNFAIAYIGLKKEVHHFEYQLDASFFTNAENLGIQSADIHIAISLDKRIEPFIIDVLINGSITTECDKCASLVAIPVIGNHTLYVKFSGGDSIHDSLDDDILIIHREEPEIDLSPFLHDYVHLSLPVSKVCVDPGNTDYCDKEVVRILEQMKNNIEPKQNNGLWQSLEKLKNIN
jgi:uncharacterized metal-binding protein YceD (DUF177 family)